MTTPEQFLALNATAPGALRGPANPEAYRITRNRQRWYHDPLPECPIATATTREWPAISTVKRAWPSTFRKRWTDGNTYELDHLRIARWVDERVDVIARLPSDERIPLIASSAERDLNRAAERGTSVHSVVEAMLAGQEPPQVFPEHAAYLPAVSKMVAEVPMRLAYAEVVAISRRLGIGATADAFVEIDGALYIVDWKTRGADSKHGAYEGEAAQIGAIASADYLIADVDGVARRVEPPEATGGLIVSIKPDSVEFYPIEIDAAIESAEALKACWDSTRDGRSAARRAIGKPVTFARPLAATVADDSDIEPGSEPDGPTPTPADRTAWVKARVEVLRGIEGALPALAKRWPEGIAPPKEAGRWSDDDLATILPTLEHVEARFRAPFPEASDPEAPARPAPRPIEPPVPAAPALAPLDDGPVAPDGTAEAIKAQAADPSVLAEGRQYVASRWAGEAERHGRPWTAEGGVVHERHAAVLHAAIACAQHLYDEDDGQDALARAALALVVGEEVQPTWRTGAVLGSLTTAQAQRLTEIAALFAEGDATTCAEVLAHVPTAA